MGNPNHMKTTDHLQIHQSNREWESDIQMWSDDLKMWKKEGEALNDSLAFIFKAVKNHEDNLIEHLKAVLKHQTEIRELEEEISLISEGSMTDIELVNRYNHMHRHHYLHELTHRRLKNYHHAIMTLTKTLMKGLESEHY